MECAGALYHVMARGNERQIISGDDKDYRAKARSKAGNAEGKAHAVRQRNQQQLRTVIIIGLMKRSAFNFRQRESRKIYWRADQRRPVVPPWHNPVPAFVTRDILRQLRISPEGFNAILPEL
jgi:hypothetical protein